MPKWQEEIFLFHAVYRLRLRKTWDGAGGSRRKVALALPVKERRRHRIRLDSEFCSELDRTLRTSHARFRTRLDNGPETVGH